MYQLQISKDLPLDKLLQKKEPQFYVANRKLDSLKNITQNISVLTKETLQKSGVNSLAEALQLLPEFIVKLKTNGVYEVEYRGSNSNFNNLGNENARENLLLLLDAVPFNDALSGQIWWESAPVGVEDIERIEVIHSPNPSWFGYAGVLAVINIVTKNNAQVPGTQIKGNLQAGSFHTYQYHASLNVGFSDKLSFRIGGNFQTRPRFQDTYYIHSEKRYLESDSLLFYLPEATQTNTYTGSALASTAFLMSTSYSWADFASIEVDMGSQNSRAQSIFLPAREVPLSTRKSQNNWINLHLNYKLWRSNLYYQSGEKDYAIGYTGWDYNAQKAGARVERHVAVSKFDFLAGGEWTTDRYIPKSNAFVVLPLLEEGIAQGDWTRNQASVYFQQSTHFLNRQVKLSAGQKVYQQLQGVDFPFGYHGAVLWNITPATTIRANISKTYQSFQYLLQDTIGHQAQELQTQELSLEQLVGSKAKLKATFFRQKQKLEKPGLEYLALPATGATVAGTLDIDRWSMDGHVSYLFDSQMEETVLYYPHWSAVIKANYSTFFDRVNLNATANYLSEHYERVNTNLYQINEQVLVNSKCSYQFRNQYSIYINVKNILNEKQYALPFTDQNHRLFMLGINILL